MLLQEQVIVKFNTCGAYIMQTLKYAFYALNVGIKRD